MRMMDIDGDVAGAWSPASLRLGFGVSVIAIAIVTKSSSMSGRGGNLNILVNI